MRRYAVLGLAVALVLAGCSAPLGTPDAATGETTATPTTELPATTGVATATEYDSGVATAAEPGAEGTPATATAATDATEPAAGDSTATAPRTPLPAATDSPGVRAAAERHSIRVENGTLPVAVNPNLTFARMQRLLGTDVSPPTAVRIRSGRTLTADAFASRPFLRLFGVGSSIEDGPTATGLTRGPNAVTLSVRAAADGTTAETTLAHEFVHVTQIRAGWFDALVNATHGAGAAGSTDGDLAFGAVLEGAAVAATDAYRRTYLPRVERARRSLVRRYRTASAGERYTLAPYFFGTRYVASRIDSPTDLGAVQESAPRTTEELIHRLSPGSEPPVPLRVAVAGSGEAGWRAVERATAGELFVRIALGPALSDARAARAAAGWGNDRRLTFERSDGSETDGGPEASGGPGTGGTDGTGGASEGGERGYAWVLRFDDAANATDFAGALETSLDRRARRVGGERTGEGGRAADESGRKRTGSGRAANGSGRTDGSWRTDGTAFAFERVDDRTVVLFLGAPGFVDGASAGVADGRVVVRPGE
jgi:hypothetical protein